MRQQSSLVGFKLVFSDTNNKKTAFNRARSDLVSKGILQVADDYYCFGDKATFGDKR